MYVCYTVPGILLPGFPFCPPERMPCHVHLVLTLHRVHQGRLDVTLSEGIAGSCPSGHLKAFISQCSDYIKSVVYNKKWLFSPPSSSSSLNLGSNSIPTPLRTLSWFHSHLQPHHPNCCDPWLSEPWCSLVQDQSFRNVHLAMVHTGWKLSKDSESEILSFDRNPFSVTMRSDCCFKSLRFLNIWQSMSYESVTLWQKFQNIKTPK